jgi:hypothetical protein
MNKKTLTILLILAAIIIGISIIFYLQSFKTVRLNFKKADILVNIYQNTGDDQAGETKIATLDKTGELRLQNGRYVIMPEGEKYDRSSIKFEVKNADQTIDINPGYSASHLDSLLNIELPALHSVLTSMYPRVITGFTLDRGRLYDEGQWYATTLTQKTMTPDEEGDIYRTVLKKENGIWNIKAKPDLLLSTKAYPNIPKAILSNINAKQ